jgi:hypothetical protein
MGGNGNGVEAYALPKGERGLPLVLRRLGKFKSMVSLTCSCLVGGWETGIDDRISNLRSGN